VYFSNEREGSRIVTPQILKQIDASLKRLRVDYNGAKKFISR